MTKTRLSLAWICPECFEELDADWFCGRCQAKTDSPMLEVRTYAVGDPAR
jgi:rubredoxin